MDFCEGLSSGSGEEERESKRECRPRKALKSGYTLCNQGRMCLRWTFPWLHIPVRPLSLSFRKAQAGSESDMTHEMAFMPGPGVQCQGQGWSHS